jgi:hypothetical protein
LVIKTLDPDPSPDSLEMLDPDPTTLVCLLTCAELKNVEKNVEAAVHHQDVLQELPLLHQQGRGYCDSLNHNQTMHVYYCSVADPDTCFLGLSDLVSKMQDQDLIVRDMDPRIWIRTKMSRIRNTGIL